MNCQWNWMRICCTISQISLKSEWKEKSAHFWVKISVWRAFLRALLKKRPGGGFIVDRFYSFSCICIGLILPTNYTRPVAAFRWIHISSAFKHKMAHCSWKREFVQYRWVCKVFITAQMLRLFFRTRAITASSSKRVTFIFYGAACECIWVYVWVFMSVCECVWVYLSVYGCVWVYVTGASVWTSACSAHMRLRHVHLQLQPNQIHTEFFCFQHNPLSRWLEHIMALSQTNVDHCNRRVFAKRWRRVAEAFRGTKLGSIVVVVGVLSLGIRSFALFFSCLWWFMRRNMHAPCMQCTQIHTVSERHRLAMHVMIEL